MFISVTVALTILFSACSSGPKTLDPIGDQQASETGIFEIEPAKTQEPSSSTSDEIHTVRVIETLETQKYSYLKVEEGGTSFWVATLKGDFTIGDSYHFTGGLLKKNFKSVEHNRVFDELYLVSNIVPLNHGSDGQSSALSNDDDSEESAEAAIVVEGSLTIAQIVEKAESLNGQTVQISGKVVKVNPNIMNRNWIHLKDGSKDDFDLVITTEESVQVGVVATYKATVTTNKDFGAGYSYKLILEQGELVK